MDTKSTGLILGVLGMATAYSVTVAETAQAQITTCDDPNTSTCSIMLQPCGSGSDGYPLWCEVQVCYESCC
jgi:hypothetical protein